MSGAREHDELTVKEQAVMWLCELADEATDKRPAFTAWLRESPRHVEEFLLSTALWRELDGAGPTQSGDVELAIGEARRIAGVGAANVIYLGTPSASAGPLPAPAKPDRAAHRQRGKRKVGAAAAAILVALGLVWKLGPVTADSQTYATAAGEQHVYALADGSTLHLNMKSRVKVRFTEDRRELQLLEGEASFKVGRDPARPFRVHAGEALIQALGTQFNVNRRPSSTTVSVFEGAVRIQGDRVRASAPTTDLTAGQEARIARDGRVERRGAVDAASSVLWRQHRLVFRDDTLEDIAAEFNRYGTQSLRLEGEAARNKRLTGSFAPDDLASFVLFLRQERELTVQSIAEGFLVKAPESGSPATAIRN